MTALRLAVQIFLDREFVVALDSRTAWQEAASIPATLDLAYPDLASPSIENSNRLVGWLRGMEGLRRGLNAA